MEAESKAGDTPQPGREKRRGSAGKRREAATVDLPPFYQSPAVLLNELGIDDPRDIRIEAIAQYCGATIVYEPLQGSDARLVGFGQRAFITVNSQSNLPRQRFSAAHELGHWMWDRGKLAACGGFPVDGNPGEEQNGIERRANRYAVDLLLPETLFAQEVGRQGGEPCFKVVQALTQAFLTSVTATAIRYVELSPYPMVLVASDRQRRKWYIRSSQIPRVMKLREKPHPKSLAARLLADPKAEVTLEEMPADRWIENEGAEDSSLKEDAIAMGPEFVLSLLSWKHDN